MADGKSDLERLRKYILEDPPEGRRWEWYNIGGKVIGELVDIDEDDDRPLRGRVPRDDYRFGRRRLG